MLIRLIKYIKILNNINKQQQTITRKTNNNDDDDDIHQDSNQQTDTLTNDNNLKLSIINELLKDFKQVHIVRNNDQNESSNLSTNSSMNTSTTTLKNHHNYLKNNQIYPVIESVKNVNPYSNISTSKLSDQITFSAPSVPKRYSSLSLLSTPINNEQHIHNMYSMNDNNNPIHLHENDDKKEEIKKDTINSSKYMYSPPLTPFHANKQAEDQPIRSYRYSFDASQYVLDENIVTYEESEEENKEDNEDISNKIKIQHESVVKSNDDYSNSSKNESSEQSTICLLNIEPNKLINNEKITDTNDTDSINDSLTSFVTTSATTDGETMISDDSDDTKDSISNINEGNEKIQKNSIEINDDFYNENIDKIDNEHDINNDEQISSEISTNNFKLSTDASADEQKYDKITDENANGKNKPPVPLHRSIKNLSTNSTMHNESSRTLQIAYNINYQPITNSSIHHLKQTSDNPPKTRSQIIFNPNYQPLNRLLNSLNLSTTTTSTNNSSKIAFNENYQPMNRPLSSLNLTTTTNKNTKIAFNENYQHVNPTTTTKNTKIAINENYQFMNRSLNSLNSTTTTTKNTRFAVNENYQTKNRSLNSLNPTTTKTTTIENKTTKIAFNKNYQPM